MQAVQNRRQERGGRRGREARFLEKDNKSNAKLRIVMHNACTSAINKREEDHQTAISTGFRKRVARCMGGDVFKRTRKENIQPLHRDSWNTIL